MDKVLCLCPTYGRPKLLANSLALFLNQTYENKFLLIFDDFGQYGNFEGESYRVVSSTKRSENMPDKYRRMLEMVDLREFAAICIWDDDDIYLPKHIEYHMKVLKRYYWSKPSFVYTICPTLALESVQGNHWASYAFQPDVFVKCLPETNKAYWDLLLIKEAEKHSFPGSINEPTFIFRWQSTYHPHLQNYIQDPHDETSYQRFPAADKSIVNPLVPMLDEETQRLLHYGFTEVGFKK